jgi:hypothetical protein
MGKYRPNIVIRTSLSDTLDAAATLSEADPRYDEICARLEKYSITPRTLKSVTEFSVSSPVAASSSVSAASLEEYISLEQYSYDKSSVSRYKIKSELITADPATSKVLGEGSSISKGDSASIASSKYPASKSKESTLHSLEKFIIKQVIKGFLDGSSVVSVIDIFERNLGQEVILESTGHPKTHSVVLHFVAGVIGEASICVVDPSNFIFSRHLENDDLNTQLSNEGIPEIKTIKAGKFQIYTPVLPTGYKFDQHRDCSDIAVKIALALNISPLAEFDEGIVKSHHGIVTISNNPKIDDLLDESITSDKLAARIKQSSSVACREAFYKSENLIMINCEFIRA